MTPLSFKSSTLVLVAALSLAGCSKEGSQKVQGDPAATAAAEATPMAKAKGVAAIDRSHAGEPMPKLDLVNPGTKDVLKVADLQGKPVLLNLWATWCAPCVKEMPLLEDLAGSYRDLMVVNASQDTDAERMLAYFEKEKFQRLRPWLDEQGALGMEFGGSLPVSVLYDASGKEVWRVIGDVDWADPQVRGAIDEALPAG